MGIRYRDDTQGRQTRDGQRICTAKMPDAQISQLMLILQVAAVNRYPSGTNLRYPALKSRLETRDLDHLTFCTSCLRVGVLACVAAQRQTLHCPPGSDAVG